MSWLPKWAPDGRLSCCAGIDLRTAGIENMVLPNTSSKFEGACSPGNRPYCGPDGKTAEFNIRRDTLRFFREGKVNILFYWQDGDLKNSG